MTGFTADRILRRRSARELKMLLSSDENTYRLVSPAYKLQNEKGSSAFMTAVLWK